MDCVDQSGNCFILYSATVKLLLFKINYAAFIFSDAFNIVTERSSLHKGVVTSHNQQLTYFNKYLKINGSWEKAENPVEALLYNNANGIVNWNCHHPLSISHIHYNDRSFSGLGYVETLFLSIKPWLLPIDELRWGRFLAPGVAITWIQWAGENPINKIYFNGEEFNDARHSDESVTFNEGKNKLEFADISVIRHVKFSDHLSKVPWFRVFLNKRILDSVESKYKSKTLFHDASGEVHHGWSIFEVVKWEH